MDAIVQIANSRRNVDLKYCPSVCFGNTLIYRLPRGSTADFNIAQFVASGEIYVF